MLLERRMSCVSCTTWGVHIWRVEYDAVYLTVLIGKITAVDTIQNVCRKQPVGIFRDIPPKDAFAIGHIRYRAKWGNIQTQNAWEYVVITIHVCRVD